MRSFFSGVEGVNDGVGFASYDTLDSLAWGAELARGQSPGLRVLESPRLPTRWWRSLGVVLAPLARMPRSDVMVALGFLALVGRGSVLFVLGAGWVSWPAVAAAALFVLSRYP